MTDLVFDIYPADDPLDGTRLVRLTSDDVLQGSGYRAERRGTGSGTIKLSAKHTAVTSGYLVEKNYVRVIDLDLGASGEVIGGMWLNEGEEVVLSEDEGGGKILSYSGQGPLYYLHNEVMGDTALSASAGPHDQELIDANGRWSWGTAGAETYGGILRRAIIEAILKSPSGIPALSSALINWDDDDDSASAAWPIILNGGERFEINVGDNLLDTAAMMMSTGAIDLYMDPDIFQIDALIADTDGTDRTGTSFGSGVVRFVGGTNIASDLKKAIHESPRVTHMLVIGSDGVTFVNVVDPDWSSGDLVIRGAIRIDSTNDSDALEGAGLKAIADRKLQTDVATFPHVPGDDDTAGKYTPGKTNGHYWLGDQVTLHTGTGTNDYNNQTMRVAAISWVMREAGDWDIQPELGATYMSVSRAAFDARTGGACNCGPTLRLCDPTIAGTTATKITASWQGHNLVAGSGSDANLIDGNTGTGCELTPWSGNPTWQVDLVFAVEVSKIRVYHPTGGGEFDDLIPTEFEVRYASASDYSDEAVAATVNPVSGGGWVEATFSQTARYWRLVNTGGTPAGADSLDGWAVNEIELYSASDSGSDPLSGTDPCAARGDHGHAAFAASAPTVDDDLSAGYRKGTFWYDTATDTLYISSDDTEGAAVWEEVGGSGSAAAVTFDATGLDNTDADDVQEAISDLDAAITAGTGVTDHGALTGLADDDHPQYLLGTDGGKGTVNVVAAAGSTETLDLADGNDHDVTLTADCTLTLAGATAGVSCYMSIKLRQDSTGGWEVTWPASVNWVGGSAPTLQTAADTWDRITLVTYDGGTSWDAQHAGTSSGGSDTAWIVDPGTPSYSGTGPVTVALTSKFGIDSSGNPYYNAANVTDGEEAALVWDSSTETYSLRPYYS